MSIDKLREHRELWRAKPGLRAVYEREFFARLLRGMASGRRNLEVGGGPGLFREHCARLGTPLFSSDLEACPWHELCLDAQALPFKDRSLDNLLGLDFLHHLIDPAAFLTEAERALRPGGRCVLVEPWISAMGYVVNRFFMPENVDLAWRPGEPAWRPCRKSERGPAKDPFEANAAVPYVLFARRKEALAALAPGLRVRELERFAILAYPLTLGFRRGSLLPGWAYPAVRAAEGALLPVLRGLAALKTLVILEKV